MPADRQGVFPPYFACLFVMEERLKGLKPDWKHKKENNSPVKDKRLRKLKTKGRGFHLDLFVLIVFKKGRREYFSTTEGLR